MFLFKDKLCYMKNSKSSIKAMLKECLETKPEYKIIRCLWSSCLKKKQKADTEFFRKPELAIFQLLWIFGSFYLCQAQSQLQVKLSLKTELALFSINPARTPTPTRQSLFSNISQ